MAPCGPRHEALLPGLGAPPAGTTAQLCRSPGGPAPCLLGAPEKGLESVGPGVGRAARHSEAHVRWRHDVAITKGHQTSERGWDWRFSAQSAAASPKEGLRAVSLGARAQKGDAGQKSHLLSPRPSPPLQLP